MTIRNCDQLSVLISSMGWAAVLQSFSSFKNENKEKPLIDSYYHNFSDVTGSDFTKN